MAHLILIKHAMPKVTPEITASEWPLSNEGRIACSRLAAWLDAYPPDVIVTSSEPKAAETGRLVAEARDLPVREVANLHEHDRRDAPFFYDKRDFETVVERMFKQPWKLVYGNETAEESYTRFSTALEQLVQEHEGQNLAVVSHGTVMSLLVQRRCEIDGFALWQRLGLPAVVVLEMPDFRLVEIAETI